MNEQRTPLIRPDPAFLEAVYQTTVTPQSYDALTDRWLVELDKAVGGLGDRREETAEDTDLIEITNTVPHLETSFRILEALGRGEPAAKAANNASSGIPKFIMARDGAIIWYNGIASRDLDLTKSMNLRSLKISATGRALVEAALESLSRGGAPVRPFVIALESKRRRRAIHMIATVFTSRNDGPHLKFEQAEARWNTIARALMTSAFDLTKSEIDIVTMLVRGHDSKSIATMRGRKHGTVRTQLKSVLRKTRTHSQNELIRLCLIVATHAPQDEQVPQDNGDGPRFFTLPCGRSMPYHEFGPADGAPVLFIHGMLDGVHLTERAAQLLERKQLRIIAPERPYFGSAEGDGSRIEDAMKAFGKDAAKLIEHLGVERLAIVGHMSGVLPAFATATELGDRARAVVSVSGGVPIVSANQLKLVSPRQRMMAYTARYTPSALPFIIRAGVHTLDSGGSQSLMDALYVESEPDRDACANAEIYNIVSAGYRHAIAQGHWAFQIDAYHVVRDWTALVEATDCPIHLLHSPYDPAVPISAVRTFAKRYSQRAVLHENSNQGQLMYYSDPDFVIGLLAKIVKDAGIQR